MILKCCMVCTCGVVSFSDNSIKEDIRGHQEEVMWTVTHVAMQLISDLEKLPVGCPNEARSMP